MLKKVVLILLLLFSITSCNQVDTNKQSLNNTIEIKGFFSSYENELIDLRINLPKKHNGSYSLENLKYDYKLNSIATSLLSQDILQLMFTVDTPGSYVYKYFTTKINDVIYDINTEDLTFEILDDKNLSKNKIVRIEAPKIIKFEKAILESDNYHALISNVSNKNVYISDVIIGKDVFDKISIAYSKDGINYSYINKYIEILPGEKCFIRANFLLRNQHGYFILKPYIEFFHGNSCYTKPLEVKSMSL